MQATITVDALTWALLWPMLSRSPDPDRVAFYRTQFFSFTSYNTVRGFACLAAQATAVLLRDVNLAVAWRQATTPKLEGNGAAEFWGAES